MVQVGLGEWVPEVVYATSFDAPSDSRFVHPSMDYSLKAARRSEMGTERKPTSQPITSQGPRRIDPRRGVIVLANGIEVPMTRSEMNRWGNERAMRCLTPKEEEWQKEQAAKQKLDRTLCR